MTRRTILALGAVAAALAVTAQATPVAAAPSGPEVPGTIAVEAGHKVFLVAHAVGVQKYSCDGSGWQFDGPLAVLYDDQGKVLGDHFGGPTWRARDGSQVVGRRVDGVTVDPTAIPWLLVARDSSAAGPDGDRLVGTTYIQRVATTGGLQPADGTCTPESAGTAREVPYTADYYFWKQTG